MRIARTFAASLAALTVCLMVSQANAQWTRMTGPVNENIPTLSYDPNDGHVWFNSGGPGATTLEFKSAGSLFNADVIKATGNFNTAFFDVVTPAKVARILPAGTVDLEFGTPAVPAGLSYDAVASDMRLDGSFVNDGSGNLALGRNGLGLYVVPEPSSVALLAMGLVGLFGLRRRS